MPPVPAAAGERSADQAETVAGARAEGGVGRDGAGAHLGELGSGEEPAGGEQGREEGVQVGVGGHQLARRPGPGGVEPGDVQQFGAVPVVAVRVRAAEGGLGRGGHVGVAQAQPLDDPRVQLVGEVVAGDAFDQQARQQVVGVAVLPAFAGRERRRVPEREVEELAGLEVPDLLAEILAVVRQARGLLEQLTDRDAPPVDAFPADRPGQVVVDVAVQPDPPLRDQLEHHDGDEGLGVAAHPDLPVDRHRRPVREVSDSRARTAGSAVPVADGGQCARNAELRHQGVEALLHGRRRRGGSGGGHGGRGGREQRQDGRRGAGGHTGAAGHGRRPPVGERDRSRGHQTITGPPGGSSPRGTSPAPAADAVRGRADDSGGVRRP